MTVNIERILKDAIALCAEDRAMVAHCLIASLESEQESEAGEAWGQLVERRFADFEAGKTKAISWQQMKENIKLQT